MYTWFHDDHRIYLALEFAGQGELYGHLRGSPGGRFSEHRYDILLLLFNIRFM